MQQFRVKGIERETGKSFEVALFAESFEDAAAKASRQGIIVESIILCETRVPPLQSFTPRENILSRASKPEKHRSWLLLPIFFAVLMGLSNPIVPILAGACFILVAVGVFVPQSRHLSAMALRLDSQKKLSYAFRVIAYFSLGLLLLLIGISFQQQKNEERLLAEQAALAEEESLRVASEANLMVLALTKDAQADWEAGQKDRALEKIEKALAVENAANFSPAFELRLKIANADVAAQYELASAAARSGDITEAKKNIASALGVQNATDFEAVNKLERFLQLLDDDNHEGISQALRLLPEEEFEAVEKGEKLPLTLVSGFDGLDRKLTALIKQEIPKLKAMRAEDRRREEEQIRLRAEAEGFVHNGIGRKVPYKKWEIFGIPSTLEGTSSKYWIAYIEKVDVSFVSEKESDTVIFAAFGKEKAREFLKNREAERDKLLSKLFSAWDGSNYALTNAIKDSMNDPGSYEHVETSYWDMNDHIVVQTVFRGKNAFGGLVKNRVKAKVDLEGNVIRIIEQD